jgi:carboxymethylenebutenolidase
VHDIGRRDVLRRLAILAGSVSAPWLGFAASSAAQVVIPSEFDTSLDSIAVAFTSASRMTLGYMSQPKANGTRPGVVLLHDVRGLTPGIRGAARNLATAGYAVVAPDFLSPQGGSAGFRGVDAAIERAVTATSARAVAEQATSALGYVKAHGGSGGRGLGLLGFGWGATQTLRFAAGRTDIAACVAFYPDPKQALPLLAKVAAPALVILAGEDPATKAGAQGVERAAAASRRGHVARVFSGMTIGFHDPGNTAAYKPDAAKQAWSAAVQHLDGHTKG